jgi:hypothetical protein
LKGKKVNAVTPEEVQQSLLKDNKKRVFRKESLKEQSFCKVKKATT